MQLSFFFSRAFLGSSFMLWALFGVNFLGTIYGYFWYGDQLVFTLENYPGAMIPFVPDSPTASLFFTAFLAYLLADRAKRDSQSYGKIKPVSSKASPIRKFIEAFAVVTSFKYGVWAVSMIFAAAAQGDTTTWQDWMLVISHSGMAFEALLYVGFYSYSIGSVVLVACWTLLNDYMDYGQGVYPWLPTVLEDDLSSIAVFTVGLSLVSIVIAQVMIRMRQKS